MSKLIIDGFNLAYRSHFAFLTLTTKTGLLSGCVYGFLTTLRSVRNKYPEFDIVVAWDSYAKRKKELYPLYKATRSHFNIGPMIQDIKVALSCLKVTQTELEGEEADDVIATLCKKSEELVYIYSSDKDLLQLVRDGKVILIRPKVGATEERVYDEEAVKKEFGVSPQDFACYLTFRGDTSDNIPGVPRIPSKVIASLSSKYKEPTAIYAKLGEEQLTDFQRKSIIEAQAQVFINYALVRLSEDLDVVSTVGIPDADKFALLLAKYDIKAIDAARYVELFSQDASFFVRTGPSFVAVKTYSIFDDEE